MWSTKNNKPIVFERKATISNLLDRAASAQLHNYNELWSDYGDVYKAWMCDRQQLVDLIHELATKVKELSS